MNELITQEVWLCDWCRKRDPVRAWYEEDYRVTVGNCDRCGKFTAGLWHMVRRSVLDLMAEV
jgi:hypothetical protein